MLYKQNNTEKLDLALFQNPTCEYRGAPFWAWNCKLDEEMLLKQIECLKQMGLGGFHMHTRSGMATKYLSDEFMHLIRQCVEKAKEEHMLAWLYDEDRWPSGAAGGYVTKTPKYRQKFLLFTKSEEANAVSQEEGIETGKPYLLGLFDVNLTPEGTLSSYQKIESPQQAKGDLWFAYVCTPQPSGWYNNQTYVDTLSNEAMDEFIRITYHSYQKAVGEEFGKTIPAIFTDEPQFSRKQTLPFAQSQDDVVLPWTSDLADTYQKAYGMDLVASLPELFWDLPDAAPSKIRYYYHDHVCQRFTEAFADNCGGWCRQNGLMLTGHMMAEPSLESQTAALGEAMRAYRSFGLPGIDMLCDQIELTTAKQAQSAVHQFGQEGVLSELYGVTNWDFDFRGHKFQGDWQAALGVTVRVHHLSWVSMKGSAKRDYPASINYQSPWHPEYSYVEDHFARLNTALTRGKPRVTVGVIHPIESYWLHWGPSDSTSEIRSQLDENFQNITRWLLTGLVDFDFISESLLPQQCQSGGYPLAVGEMRYSTIVVPGCETLRSTTLQRLEEFQKQGGRVIFVGDCPKYIDAACSDKAKALYEKSVKAQFSKNAVLHALEQEREIVILDENGNTFDRMISTRRMDGDVEWLFLAHVQRPDCKDVIPPERLTIKIQGAYKPWLYDTINGSVEEPLYEIKDGQTIVYRTIYAYDSLLLQLAPKVEGDIYTGREDAFEFEQAQVVNGGSTAEVQTKNRRKILVSSCIGSMDCKEKVSYSLEEDNVYLLDMAQYSLDGGKFQPLEELLRIDTACRKPLGFPLADGHDAQPWVIGEEPISHFVTLRFTIPSEISTGPIYLAAEEVSAAWWNGKPVSLQDVGYYVDASIRKYPLPGLTPGDNILELKVPFGPKTSIEWCYLLGDFGVRTEGCVKTVISRPKTISFGSVTNQGMPFYGGNIHYKTKITLPGTGLRIHASSYRGSLIKVLLDGKDVGKIVYAPYSLELSNLKPGEHEIELILYGTRINTFGSLHNCGNNTWYGPDHWYSKGDEWSYEYQLKNVGILKSPVFEFFA